MITPERTGRDSRVASPGSAELEALVERIANAGAQRELSNEHPFEAMEAVRRAHLGAYRLPIAEGGGGASLRQLFDLVVALSEADPAVPHILRAHFEFVETQLLSSKDWASQHRPAVASGRLYGNAATEIGSSASVGSGKYSTRLEPEGENYRLNGTKYYCTGTFYSDFVLAYATLPDDRVAAAVIPVGRQGVSVEDDWDGIGQGRTGSGTTTFEEVRVGAEELIFVSDDDAFSIPYRTAFAQLYLTAIVAGIMRAVVKDAVGLLRGRQRGFSHAPAESPPDDPLLQEIVGRIAAAAFAAESTVFAAADELDSAFADFEAGYDRERLRKAALLAAEAKVAVDRMGLSVSTELFEVGGASATQRSKNLDRHWRNIRTLASHNPDVYKARAVGNHLINGEDLPQNGFF